METIIFGLGFKARRGKDEFANALTEAQNELNIEVYRVAFADSLKDEVYDMVLKPNNISRKNLDDASTKEYFRPLLQWWGTEFRRELNIPEYKGNQNYWVDQAKNKIQTISKKTSNKTKVICVCDTRFLSECIMLKSLNAKLVRIDRNFNNESTHSSEKALENYDGWDYILENNGTLKEYKTKVKDLFKEVLKSF